MKYSSIGTLVHLLGGSFATAVGTLRAQEDVQQMQIGVFASADRPWKGDDERQRLRPHKKTSPAAGAGKTDKEGEKKSEKSRIENSASPTTGKAGKTTVESTKSTKSKKSKKSKSAKRSRSRMPTGSPTKSPSIPIVEAPTYLPTNVSI